MNKCKMGFCNNERDRQNPNNPKGSILCKECKELTKDTANRNGNFKSFSQTVRSLVSLAKSRNPNEFEIDVDYIYEIWPEDNCCPILKRPLKTANGKYDKRTNSPSLDRINSEIGYKKGNVMVVSNLANRMKQNATTEELKLFAEYILNELK